MANEALEQKHADDLSVGRYTFKKIRETVISFGGTFGGAIVGGMIGGAMSKDKVARMALPSHFPVIGGKKFTVGQANGGFVGFMIGSLISGLAIGYEHWRKVESQKLAVDEINQDIANTVAVQPVDKELVSENKRLREMLAEREAKGSNIENILAHGPKTHHDHAKHPEGHQHSMSA